MFCQNKNLQASAYSTITNTEACNEYLHYKYMNGKLIYYKLLLYDYPFCVYMKIIIDLLIDSTTLVCSKLADKTIKTKDVIEKRMNVSKNNDHLITSLLGILPTMIGMC